MAILYGTRYFKPVKDVNPEDVKLPVRATKGSAGYDFFTMKDESIPSIWEGIIYKILFKKPIKPTVIWTGIKAKMRPNEVLELYNRSSNPNKLGLVMSNSVGIIDSDYYSNESNDGNIGFAYYNLFPWTVHIPKGQKLGQGVFHSFLKVDDDVIAENPKLDPPKKRAGGFGSTDVESKA